MDEQARLLPDVGPVQQAQRIASIDVLRGVAVLGILIMNIQSFSMIGTAYMNPTAYGDLTGINYAVWLGSHVLADRKFMTIFSMLFGAGIVLMTTRCEAAGRKPAGVHYRRTGLLLVIGLIHSYALWYGDILYTYAMCGFVAYLFRRMRPATLIVLGVILIGVASCLAMLFQLSLPHWPEENLQEMVKFWTPSQETVAEEVTTYRGGWLTQMNHRAVMSVFFQTLILFIENVWRVGGLMLIGMALFKLGVFSAKRSTTAYVIMIAVALIIGIPVILLGVRHNFAADWEFQSSMYLGSQFNYWGSLLVAIGWVGLVMLLCKHQVVPSLTRTLGAVGQMAFTCYLLQSIICTTLFYGHGFGQFGKVERVGQLLIVFAVWVVLLIFSSVWLRRYRFGPAEWLWRSMTYGARQPLRRAGMVARPIGSQEDSPGPSSQ